MNISPDTLDNFPLLFQMYTFSTIDVAYILPNLYADNYYHQVAIKLPKMNISSETLNILQFLFQTYIP